MHACLPCGHAMHTTTTCQLLLPDEPLKMAGSWLAGPTWLARDIMQPRQASLMQQNKWDVSAAGYNINEGHWPMNLSKTQRRGWRWGVGVVSLVLSMIDLIFG